MKTNNTTPFPITGGDITNLSPLQREAYYTTLCNHLDLDPKLQPFKMLRLRDRYFLYCDHGGVQMLNQLHHISHKILARETANGCYIVTVQATAPGYRTTECIGAVSISKLGNDKLCHAMMRAETKAKHRASLDLLGLGMLDESELFPLPLKGNLRNAGTPLPLTPSPLRAGEDEGGLPTSLFRSTAGLRNDIIHCMDEESLEALYRINRLRIDREPELKRLLEERRGELEENMIAA